MCGKRRPYVRPRPIVMLYPQRPAPLAPVSQPVCYPSPYSIGGLTGYQAPLTNYGGFPMYGQSQIY